MMVVSRIISCGEALPNRNSLAKVSMVVESGKGWNRASKNVELVEAWMGRWE